MQFNQAEFLILLPALIVVVWQCRSKLARNGLLLIASYYFYAHWDYRFCGLLALSTIIDFVVARKISRAPSQASSRAWLLVSLVSNLGMLGFFKYFNFFISSAEPLFVALDWNAQTLNIILPVGISFYTFQTLSYTIDVYRGKVQPAESFIDFALYVAFFPQLVAGPIVRASELMPQLAKMPRWSGRRCYGGAQMLLRGLLKKVLLADRLGEMVDLVFEAPELYCGATIWLAVFAYAGQIYYDFSGYTDMAIGVAKMLGYRFPTNFRHPYLATSVAEFWKRWHMTLSRWLRDYLYIPLGGNRLGERRTQVNLLLTMILGGLWHGAAWTFLFWGLWHGLALVAHRLFARRFPSQHRFGLLSKTAGIQTTWFVVSVGWVFFRAESFSDAVTVIDRMLGNTPGIHWYPPLVIGVLACMVLEHVAWSTPLRSAMRMRHDRWYSPVGTTVAIWCLLLYAPRGFAPFQYFQF